MAAGVCRTYQERADFSAAWVVWTTEAVIQCVTRFGFLMARIATAFQNLKGFAQKLFFRRCIKYPQETTSVYAALK
jgi:hypothetical protein